MADDPTEKLPKAQGRYDTQPTITTVLERLNEIGDGLRAEVETLRVGQEQLRVELREEMQSVRSDLDGEIQSMRAELGGEIQALRSEMNQQFAKVAEQFTVLDRKIGILTREVLDVRARQEVYDDRLDKLEEKKS